MSGGIPAGKHLEIRTPAAWGQGERGAEGYNDSGGSELVMRDGQLLGGLTSGPSGEPTIDIHGGASSTNPTTRSGNARSVVVSMPKFGFIVATRALLAAGVALLVAEKIPENRRRTIGRTLVAVGALATIPALLFLRRGHHAAP